MIVRYLYEYLKSELVLPKLKSTLPLQYVSSYTAVALSKMLQGFPVHKNYNDINATLGSLQRFLSDYSNQDLFLDAFGDGRRFVSDYLKQQISFWRDNYRNGYFHKHNLNDLEKVKQIRNQTIFLYMMILGSLDLRTEDLEELMY